LTFRAVDDDQARATIDDQEGSMQSDLKVLVDADEKPLWDGKSTIHVREATATQHAEWKRSRDQAIRDEEIDLDARNDPDEWNVYLMGAPKNKVRRKKIAKFTRRACPSTSRASLERLPPPIVDRVRRYLDCCDAPSTSEMGRCC
jgi:hypothetical protein